MSAPLAFITGASSGIGQALAARYVALGWRVVLVARRAEAMAAWARTQTWPAERWAVYAADVRDEASLQAAAADCLALRGSTREVILKPRLIEVLQSRRFDYKGEWFPLSPSGIDQILRQVQAVNLTEGLLSANERVYQMLTLGVTVTE